MIPSYTVRFSRSYKHRPFGIAYAEFKSIEDATKVVKELNGATFKDRPIYVKLHAPFKPKGKPIFGFKRRSTEEAKPSSAKTAKSLQPTKSRKWPHRNKNVSQEGKENANGDRSQSPALNSDDQPNDKSVQQATSSLSPVTIQVNSVDVSSIELPENKDASAANSGENDNAKATEENTKARLKSLETEKSNAEKKQVSKDTIFLGKVHSKITDQEVREFFEGYQPTQIFIFKGAKRSRRGSLSFRQRTVSVLVTISNENDLSNAIDALKKKKLKGKYVLLEPAYLHKVEEVVEAAKRSANGAGDDERIAAVADHQRPEENVNDSLENDQKTSDVSNKEPVPADQIKIIEKVQYHDNFAEEKTELEGSREVQQQHTNTERTKHIPKTKEAEQQDSENGDHLKVPKNICSTGISTRDDAMKTSPADSIPPKSTISEAVPSTEISTDISSIQN